MPTSIKVGDEIVDTSVPKTMAHSNNVVLYANVWNETPSEYLSDPSYGDAVLDAIINGRPVLVRIPGKGQVGANATCYEQQHTALFSPVVTYQIPNYENDYLYLFYLRDEKNYIDLGAYGQVEVPVYGELKMKLSTKYDKCPIEHKTRVELGDLFTRR